MSRQMIGGRSRWITFFTATILAAPAMAVTVPLGNLFDDAPGTPLPTAIASDTYQATGAVGDLGIVTVLDGTLGSSQLIAPGVFFNLGNANAGGGNNVVAGKPSNDTFRDISNVAIRTTGVPSSGAALTTKQQDGIGMHADELITFDLGALRTAGGLSNHASYFTARAGINDSAGTAANMNAIVIVSDANGNVLSGYINGEQKPVTFDGSTWTFAAAPSASLTGSTAATRLTTFSVALPAEAAYLTLAGTSRPGLAGDANSDHAVFANANWDSHAIPLGNLFGDAPGVSLAAAIATDVRAQAPSAADRYIAMTQAGGLGGTIDIGGGVLFNLATAGASNLGAGNGGAGLPGNDSRRANDFMVIRIRGTDGTALPATAATLNYEDGIGMHANSIVTFDIDEIRAGGDLAPDQVFDFTARAGLLDSAAAGGSLRTVAILSDDSGNVLATYVNGILQSVSQTGGIWSITSPLPGILAGNNNTFHDYNVFISGDVSFLTLAVLSNSPADGNNISNDHGVFSGARLTFTQSIPEPASGALLLLAGAVLARRRRGSRA